MTRFIIILVTLTVALPIWSANTFSGLRGEVIAASSVASAGISGRWQQSGNVSVSPISAGITEVRLSVNGRFFITSPGDINLDSRVDSQDLRLVARHLGSPVPQDARLAFSFGDANLDGRVDILDLTSVATRFEG